MWKNCYIRFVYTHYTFSQKDVNLNKEKNLQPFEKYRTHKLQDFIPTNREPGKLHFTKKKRFYRQNVANIMIFQKKKKRLKE